ncbi:hypothetical protein NP493_217g02051 [Ridgeia piscesae]|uniref:Transcription elongation factor SPT6 n=1 Tax=Ridgeia piscesae TaxID=27915 RepID=A0AAD9P0V8_RIDPI|nr:hypothetical protein NP493_217g02051 [Ridgeia piscesae]
MADMPERFKLRRIPVCPPEEGELDEEAEWVYKYAFVTANISRQDYEPGGAGADASALFDAARSGTTRKGPSTIGKIHEALNCMRNQQFEVPFIAFYRKEYVEPELNINDLWKVYHWDEKWMQLRNRKQNLVRLFEKMQQFQFMQVEDAPLPSGFRALTEEDIERAKNVQTMEELRDVYQHFLLYYGTDIPRMKAQQRQVRRKAREEDGEGEEEEEAQEPDGLKQASRKTGYSICVQAGLADVANKFGLTPEQFGENMRDNYQRHDVEQETAEPPDLAGQFISNQFGSSEDVLKGARHMVAMQIAHDPQVRQCLRQIFYERAHVTCAPTKKGMKEIDEAHQCYTFKYLKNKPIQELQDDQYLKIDIAEKDGLMTKEIHLDKRDNMTTYFDEIKQLYQRDEFSNLVQEWNNQRSEALERALNHILYPQMAKELHVKLLEEAKEAVVKSSCRKLYGWLKVAPYQVEQQLDDEDDEFDSSRGLRVMGVCYSTNREVASYCCVIDGDGNVVDFMRLVHIMKRKNSYRASDREAKEMELDKLKDFIATKKPHVIAVAAESREAMSVMEDIKELVAALEQEQQMAPINVELLDNELGIVYANSKKAEHDFREYPSLLRQALSLARRLQEPLVEFAQLCNPDEDILSLKYHTLQDEVNREDLMEALYLEFVNRVNEVGVDVNKCVAYTHTAPLVQFVCGLGPRKGYHLLRILKQHNSHLENRTQLVTLCHMGPKVFFNCAGFIKIDTAALGDSTEAYIEVLDGSRVHPETYEWARKMAVDALEYDDTAEDANPAGALEEILESPERLKDLDLDAFAEELERQGYGNKHITLYDIRAELNYRYKDLRTPYRSPTTEERFNLLTKETPQTFYLGKLIMCRVSGFAHKRPKGDQLDQADPVRNDETGLWQCPFCLKSDLPELSEVWNHFDAGECPGQAVGVKTQLDNGVFGFLPLKYLSDKHVSNPEERVAVSMMLHCRITKIDIERFQVELTSRSSDLLDKEGKWKLQKDLFYDYDTEETDTKKEEDKHKQRARQTYVKRVIAHPSFRNIDYKSCEKEMANMEQGEVLIRPSSKGTDHLTATWKVADGILQHIDVREEGKENAFSLGHSLWIGEEEFEDLDEIIARHIQPMAAFARDITNYKYYQDFNGGKRELAEKLLQEEKRKGPSKIPYYFSASQQYPGKFLLAYMPRKAAKYEYATVTPEGIRYRSKMFHSLNSLVRWFKEHFRDRIPGTPMTARTPMGMTGNINATPRMAVDTNAMQRARPGVFSGTPAYQPTPGTPYGYGSYQPVATPMMTPIMTPSYPSNQASLSTPAQMMGTPAPVATPLPIATPLQQPMTTPVQGGMATPQYVPTPRASWSAAQTTPVPARNPPGHTPVQQRPPSDWAKMAELWAKRKQTDPKPKRTPLPDQSPKVAASPVGGSTPLFDER